MMPFDSEALFESGY